LLYHAKKRLDQVRKTAKTYFSLGRKNFVKKSINNRVSIEQIMLGEAERLGIIVRNPWDQTKE